MALRTPVHAHPGKNFLPRWDTLLAMPVARGTSANQSSVHKSSRSVDTTHEWSRHNRNPTQTRPIGARAWLHQLAAETDSIEHHGDTRRLSHSTTIIHNQVWAPTHADDGDGTRTRTTPSIHQLLAFATHLDSTRPTRVHNVKRWLHHRRPQSSHTHAARYVLQ